MKKYIIYTNKKSSYGGRFQQFPHVAEKVRFSPMSADVLAIEKRHKDVVFLDKHSF